MLTFLLLSLAGLSSEPLPLQAERSTALAAALGEILALCSTSNPISSPTPSSALHPTSSALTPSYTPSSTTTSYTLALPGLAKTITSGGRLPPLLASPHLF